MELKVDKTTKILLGAIALGLFLNASEVIVTKAYAELSRYDIRHCFDGAQIDGSISGNRITATLNTYC